MLGNHPLAAPLQGVLTRVRDWPVAIQQQARRNAMVAATACAQRRIEREEVEDFLERHTPPTSSTEVSTGSVETDENSATRAARAHG